MSFTFGMNASTLTTRAVGWLATCLFVAVVLLYLPLSRNGFIEQYDDFEYVIENSRVNSGLKLSNVVWAFTAFHAANWHPLTWISHMIDCQFYGKNPGGHHFTNLLLHSANVLLLFGFLIFLTGAVGKSAVVAAVFAVHPMNVENVAWVAERKELLSSFFGLLTMLAWCRGHHQRLRRRSWWWSIAAFLFYVLALMSKQMLVTMPVLLAIIGWFSGGGKKSGFLPQAACQVRGRAHAAELLPFFCAALAASVVVIFAQRSAGAVAPLQHLPIHVRLINVPIAYALYVAKFFMPIRLSIMYPYPESVSWTGLGASMVLLTVVSAFAIVLRRTSPWLLYGWLWFLGTLLPVVGIVQVGPQHIANRYLYFPMIGLLLAVVWQAYALFENISRLARKNAFVDRGNFTSRLAAGTAAAWIVFLVFLTRREIAFWADDITLFSRAIEVTKRNYFAHYQLGVAYMSCGSFDKAIEQFHRSLAIRPTPSTLNNLGVLLLKLKQPAAAAAYFRQLLRHDSLEPRYWYNLGIAYNDMGHEDSALLAYRRALSEGPTYWQALNNTGMILMHRGDIDSAIAYFRRSLVVRPDNPSALLKRGYAYLAKGAKDSALADFVRLLQEYPCDTALISTTASLYAAAGDSASAVELCRRSLERCPNNPPHASCAPFSDAQPQPDSGKLSREAAAAKAATQRGILPQ